MREPAKGRRSAAPALSPALSRALRPWNALLENLPVGVYTCNCAGILVHYNERAASLWGRRPPRGDASVRYCGCLGLRHPEGTPVDLACSPVAQVLKTGQPVRDQEFVLERPDGSQITILANVEPLLAPTGRLLGAVNCFQDISERKRTEARIQERERRFRALLEALPAAIYTTDAHGKLEFYNEAAAALWGQRPSPGSAHWCGSWKLYRADGTPLPHDECPMAIAIRENRPVTGVEAVLERPDGTRIPFRPFPTPLRDDAGALVGAVNMMLDIGEEKRSRAVQQSLIDELNHRVKNTLALVQAIAGQSLDTDPLALESRRKFNGRLLALSRVHEQLSEERWQWANFEALISDILGPYSNAHESRMEFEGGPVRIPPAAALTVAMVLHELAANAVKHGALAAPSGKVAVGWKTIAADSGVSQLKIDWQERGGREVAQPMVKGFGTKLIERAIGQELHGSVELRMLPDGLHYQFHVPLGPVAC